jgi:transcriptional regulator with XRE-family HTH domain
VLLRAKGQTVTRAALAVVEEQLTLCFAARPVLLVIVPNEPDPPAPRRIPPLGSHIEELREWSGFTLQAAAKSLDCSPTYLRAIELGQRRPSGAMLARLADVLDCELAELEQLSALHERPDACAEVCSHDGAMRPGGTPDDLDDSCRHYGACLGGMARQYPKAKSGHCPRECTKREAVPFQARLGMGGGQQGERRWDTTDPPFPDEPASNSKPPADGREVER